METKREGSRLSSIRCRFDRKKWASSTSGRVHSIGSSPGERDPHKALCTSRVHPKKNQKRRHNPTKNMASRSPCLSGWLRSFCVGNKRVRNERKRQDAKTLGGEHAQTLNSKPLVMPSPYFHIALAWFSCIFCSFFVFSSSSGGRVHKAATSCELEQMPLMIFTPTRGQKRSSSLFVCQRQDSRRVICLL